MLFACVFKTYSTFSGRRFATDLKAAYAQGHLLQLPSYNSLFRYFEKPELTAILEMLIEESSRPLAALESAFAVDATGLATTHGFTWHYAKYEQPRMIQKKNWKKLHVITGTLTNVICAAKVTDKNEHDSNYFAPLVEAASKNFDMKEISADAAYLSQANMQTALDHGAFPYLAWKSNSGISACSKKNELWNKLFHLFSLNRQDFLKKYALRSNCETTFAMLKGKFSGSLRNKTSVAQENEALAKCLCHNICCLIQSICELGIKPEFYTCP
jgi:transposase